MCVLQSDIEFCILLCNHLHPYRSDNIVQHRIDIWRDNLHGLWMAHHWFLHHVCGSVHGRDLFCLPHFRWPLLLEFPIVRSQVGTFCIMDNRLVCILFLSEILSVSATIFSHILSSSFLSSWSLKLSTVWVQIHISFFSYEIVVQWEEEDDVHPFIALSFNPWDMGCLEIVQMFWGFATRCSSSRSTTRMHVNQQNVCWDWWWHCAGIIWLVRLVFFLKLLFSFFLGQKNHDVCFESGFEFANDHMYCSAAHYNPPLAVKSFSRSYTILPLMLCVC